MGLRNAQVAAAMERVGARSYSTLLSSVRLHLEMPGPRIAELDIAFAPGIGVVTGGNGAGKTTLLRGLQTLENTQKAEWPERLVHLEAKGTTSGSNWTVALDRVEGENVPAISVTEGEAPRLVFIDPADESQRIRRHFEEDANARDLLEGTDPAPFDSTWRDHASRILRRDYDFIEVFEVEGPEGDSVVPWFRICSSGVVYDTLNAGRGELSAIYLLWNLSRVMTGTIVIIDEPEAWLASFSQARLKEALAFISVEKGIPFVLTTHSPEMYLGLPASRVTVLESLPSPAAHGPMASSEAAYALGAPVRPTLALLTEDVVAAALTEAIIRSQDSILLEAVEIFHAQNGESALDQVQREFIEGNTRRRKLNMQIVLDGDQRQLNNGQRVKSDKRTYLPGDVAPDAILKQVTTAMVSTLSDDQLMQRGISEPTQFRLTISSAAGSDHHDWFVEIAKCFSSYAATCNILVRLCLEDPSFAADVDALISSIRAGLP